jgi:polyisoprenoid-binding protein YceI
MTNKSGDQLPTGTWRLDPERTAITATVKKLGFYGVAATMTVTEGTIEIDDDQQVTSGVIIDASSYTSKSSMRDRHVRSAKFLDAETHPEISFKTDVVKAGADGWTATGTIALKGLSSPMVFEGRDVKVDGPTARFRAHAVIDRRAVGVDATPAFVVANTISVDIDAVAHSAP